MRLTTVCPAKINLGLRVLRRRSDGYHELETLFVQLELADRLSVIPGEGTPTLETAGLPIDCGPDRNLVLRAVDAFSREIGQPIGGQWRLEKRIPLAAGLGGGSSDAGGALRILQRWHGYPLAAGRLHAVAASVGSDVPFFVHGGLALGRGRGEVLEEVPWPGEWSVVLVACAQGLSTPEIFGDLGSELTASVRLSTLPIIAPLTEPVTGESVYFENDLETAVLRRRPELGGLLEELRASGFDAVGLSGSGPTVYGLARNHAHARSMAGALRRPGRVVLVTRFRRRVPRVVRADDR